MTQISKTTPSSGTKLTANDSSKDDAMLGLLKPNKPSIVFFGSGPVAAACLELLAQHTQIEAVITKPKPPHHRGEFPVIKTAERLNMPIYTVSGKQSLSDLIGSHQFKSIVGVLIDFGIIVSQNVIDSFELGIINSHFSVLPEWRGADPISFSILSGQPSTGVSLMLLVEKMDEGPLLAFSEHTLSGKETTSQLTDALIDLSDAMLKEYLPMYLALGNTFPQTLTGRDVSYSRKLQKDDGIIDWHKPAIQLEREIRAYAEWPKSRCILAGKDVVITAAHVAKQQGQIGQIFFDNTQLGIYCGVDALIIDSLKPAGKNEMTASAFLAGYRHLLA